MNHIPLSTDLSPVKILVVDDHPNTATTLARALSQLGPGVEVRSATTGQEAIQQVKEGATDILITDMIMPGMTGLELIEKLQHHPSGPPIFSFLVTAYDVPGLKVTANRLKVKDVIVKPVHPERIRQIVIQAMKQMNQTREETKEAAPSKSFKILIADDQADNRRLLSRYLENEGYGYIEAIDGEDTLAQVRSDMPDLVLLDINMPNKDGFEVLTEIRADPITEHIPVIILTAARLDPSEIQSGLNMGADDYVTKPFDRRELFARIRTKLRVKEAEDLIRRRNRELNLLPEIGKDLSARLNLDELSDLVLKRTVETLGAMVGHLILLSSKSPLHKEYHVSASEGHASTVQLPPLNGLVQQITETREGVLIKDTRSDSRWLSSVEDPTRSAIIVPMFGRLALIGLLVLVHENQGYFTVEHKLLLQAIASQAAIAVENAILYANMAQQQQKLSAILQSAADAIMMFDSDSCLSMLNPAAEKLFANYETKIGLPLARDRGYDTLINTLEEAFTDGQPMTGEISWPDQRIFTALFTPIAEGGCVVVLHDVTHFKKLEKVKNEFIATASHDLRNPITSIRGYSQLIQHAGPLTENQLDFAKRIQNASKHMGELVENMLDLAKMDLDAKPQFDTLNVSQLLLDTAYEFQPQALEKQQNITLVMIESISQVRGDNLQLRQVLRNLVSNAIKYTPEGGTITLSSENQSETVEISIRDTGYGIPASDLPHIFRRFYRVRNNGHDDIEGNGLGLAIVKSMIEQHGGSIHVESESGKGSCFTVTLPLTSET